MKMIGAPGQTVVSLAMKLATGAGCTMILILYELVSEPFVAVSVTRCVPGEVKLTDGLVNTEELVVPNVQE